MSVFFNGNLIVSPATVSKVDDSAMYNRNLTVGNVLAIVGKSAGGKPATALRFGSPAQARAVLRSGESLKAIEKAFDPSPQTNAPQEVVFVRVDPATQSTATLADASAGPAINLTSEDYGAHTQALRFKVESGSVSGKKLTTQLGLDYYTQDNVERKAFSIQYDGAGAAATLSVTETQVTVSVDATDTVLDLTQYPTISALVGRINGIAGFTAIVLDGNDERPAFKGLDGLTSQDVKSALYTVKADLQACIDWFNSANEGFMSAVRPTGALKPPANVGWTYLSGGSDGSVTNTEWQAALDALQSVDVQWVVPISPSASIHAMTRTHCYYMSDVARRERRCIVGTDTATSDVTAIAAAKALNSDRLSLVHLGFYDYDAAGNLVLYPPYVLAGLVGGMISGVNPGTALTNKAVNIQGIERRLRNPTDTDQLINGRVFCVEDTLQGFKVVQSVTTWLVNNNYNRVEMSVGAAVDFTIRNVRQAVDVLRGEKGTPQLLSEVISRAETQLMELSRPEPVGPGVLVGDKTSPPFKNLTATIEGDVVRLEFQASPVIPANYILITMHAVPFSGTATA